jgi:hypothetical protein
MSYTAVPSGKGSEFPRCFRTAAQAEKEDATPPGHSLIFTVLFFGFFFPKKNADALRLPSVFPDALRASALFFGWDVRYFWLAVF